MRLGFSFLLVVLGVCILNLTFLLGMILASQVNQPVLQSFSLFIKAVP